MKYVPFCDFLAGDLEAALDFRHARRAAAVHAVSTGSEDRGSVSFITRKQKAFPLLQIPDFSSQPFSRLWVGSPSLN